MAPMSAFLCILIVAILLHPSMAEPNGFSLKLIPIDSIESPLYSPNLTLEERHQRLLHISNSRALRLASIAKPTNQTGPADIVRPPVEPFLSSIFVVLMNLGTPPIYPTFLQLDTGSDLIWVQCEGCQSCFTKKEGSFPFYKSSTYSPLSCDHPLCNPKLCVDGVCAYQVTYGMGDSSAGPYSSDSFTFMSDNESLKVLQLAFGCGLHNINIRFGDNDGPNNRIAGIFGMGGGPRSFLMQLSFEGGGGRFSYCLPTYNAPPGAMHTNLNFGNNAKITAPARLIHTTRLVEGRSRTHYYIDLLDISVLDHRLGFPPGTFKMKPDGSGGVVMDSGSAPSYLIRSAYTRLRAAMVAYFQPFQVHPLVVPGGYDLCFNRPKGFTRFPSLTFHLDGADLVCYPFSVFLIRDDVFCLAVMPSDGNVSLLGAIQQTEQRFVYDLTSSTLSFARDPCNDNT